jgi:DNA invertase Pin-like site-specific DNA recombinase
MIYADFAASGSTVHRRPEFSRMLTDAEDHQFDIIIAEDIDRLARGEGDAPKLRQGWNFWESRCTHVPTVISPNCTLA